MSTRRLKKRDRAWAKGMVLQWWYDSGRGLSTEHKARLRNARVAHEFIKGNDPFQQEAIVFNQYNQPDARVYFGEGQPKIIPVSDKAMYINSNTGTPWFWNLDRWSTQP